MESVEESEMERSALCWREIQECTKTLSNLRGEKIVTTNEMCFVLVLRLLVWWIAFNIRESVLEFVENVKLQKREYMHVRQAVECCWEENNSLESSRVLTLTRAAFSELEKYLKKKLNIVCLKYNSCLERS